MANRNLTEVEKEAAKKAALDKKIKQAQVDLATVQSEGDAEKIKKAEAVLNKLYKTAGITIPDTAPDIGVKGASGRADHDDTAPAGGVSVPENKPITGADNTGFVELILRNRTGNKTYYRCGVCIGNEFTPVKISTEDVTRLRIDPWIEEKK